MKAAAKRRRPSASVSASELAQMGVCGRLVVFEHRYGKRCLPKQRAAIERGRREHERFYREGRIASTPPGRCFIATMMFGEGPETQTLRAFRDQVLRCGPAADCHLLPRCARRLPDAGATAVGALGAAGRVAAGYLAGVPVAACDGGPSCAMNCWALSFAGSSSLGWCRAPCCDERSGRATGCRTNCHEPCRSPWMMEDTGGVRASAGRGRSIL